MKDYFDELLEELDYLGEAKKDYVPEMPSVFSLRPYAKTETTEYKGKGGLYLIVCARRTDSGFEIPPERLRFDDIKYDWPHYVGQALDLATRLDDHLTLSRGGKWEADSKLHKYMRSVFEELGENDFNDTMAKYCKFYAVEIHSTSAAKNSAKIPDYISVIKPLIGKLINGEIDNRNNDKVSSICSSLIKQRADYYNSISENSGLNQAEYD